MNLIDLVVVIIFIGGAVYCFRKYVLDGTGWKFFIGCNSTAAAFLIIKDYIPKEMYAEYNIVRITLVLCILYMVYFLRKRHCANEKKESI